MEKGKILDVSGVSAGYGQIQVIWDCTLDVLSKETVLLLGPNGAGKTTLLKTIAGVIRASSGNVHFNGNDVTKLPVHIRAKMGLVFISETSLYPSMTVRENLYMSSLHCSSPFAGRLQAVYALFPDLRRLEKERASSLSGGQRKMLIIARAVISEPSLLVVDEPSSGLSPLFTERVMSLLSRLKGMGIPALVSEQNVEFLSLADRAFVMDHGRIVHSGTPEEVARSNLLGNAYFGV